MPSHDKERYGIGPASGLCELVCAFMALIIIPGHADRAPGVHLFPPAKRYADLLGPPRTVPREGFLLDPGGETYFGTPFGHSDRSVELKTKKLSGAKLASIRFLIENGHKWISV